MTKIIKWLVKVYTSKLVITYCLLIVTIKTNYKYRWVIICKSKDNKIFLIKLCFRKFDRLK